MGGTIVAVGMVLRIADTLVGKGAIYSWVLSACWMLAPPIILLLAHWWRDRIVVLSADGADKSAVLAWNAGDPDGIAGLFGRVLAGAILLISGVRRLLIRQAKTIALVREISGQRARKHAAERVAQDRASGIYAALDDDVLAPLLPHRLPRKGECDGVGPFGPATPPSPPGAIAAIVGYRGLGKSAALQAMLEKAGNRASQIRVAAGEGGLPALLADLAADMTSSGNYGALDMQVVMDFYIGMDEDVDAARELVSEACLSSRYVYLAKPVVVLVTQWVSEHLVGVRLRLKAYVLDTKHEKSFETDVHLRVLRSFRAQGIGFPTFAAHSAEPEAAVR